MKRKKLCFAEIPRARMNAMSLIRITILIFAVMTVLSVSLSAAAENSPCEIHSERSPKLCPHEPTTLGYTKDSDDVPFMDFKISLKYQLFPDWLTRSQDYVFGHEWGQRTALYFAFTGRFGQYIGTRDSSPVVAKRFNPMLMYRTFYGERHENHVDVAYAHESNGQSIDSQAEFQTALANSADKNAVKDQLSRGWDYIELSWKKTILEKYIPGNNETKEDKNLPELVSYVSYKQFLDNGLLQGKQENYNTWENDPQGKKRNRVDGISLMLKLTNHNEGWEGWFKDTKLAFQLVTGNVQPFRYNTYRLEAGAKFLQLPLSLWVQTGYNSDLAQYYKNVTSYGIQAELGSF